MLNNIELPPVMRVTLLTREICELGSGADARQFLAREAVNLCGCAAAAVGHRGPSGALEFTFGGPADLVESLTRILAHTQEAVGAAAIELGEPVAVPDLVEEKRWSDYVTALALHTPIRSVQAHQLRLADADHGVLVLYCHRIRLLHRRPLPARCAARRPRRARAQPAGEPA